MYSDPKFPLKSHSKVARIMGATLEYHPHGDASIHEVIGSMGKTWENTNSNRMHIMKGFVCLVREILSKLQC